MIYSAVLIVTTHTFLFHFSSFSPITGKVRVKFSTGVRGLTVGSKLLFRYKKYLFDKSKKTISEHIRNIFKEDELMEKSVVRNFRTTAADGKSYNINHYNLVNLINENN